MHAARMFLKYFFFLLSPKKKEDSSNNCTVMMMNDWEKIGMYQVQMRMNSNKYEWCATRLHNRQIPNKPVGFRVSHSVIHLNWWAIEFNYVLEPRFLKPTPQLISFEKLIVTLSIVSCSIYYYSEKLFPADNRRRRRCCRRLRCYRKYARLIQIKKATKFIFIENHLSSIDDQLVTTT